MLRTRPHMPLAAMTALTVLLTGACMSQEAEDANKPLPRKSREASLDWAEKYTAAMARSAGVKTAGGPAPRTHFQACVGKNDEVADDGRYTLTYATYAKLPEAQHIAAVRKLRKALEKNGIRVTGYTEDPERPEAAMFAKHDTEGYSLIADSVNPPDTLRLSVSTPCFLPPGAKQQKF